MPRNGNLEHSGYGYDAAQNGDPLSSNPYLNVEPIWAKGDWYAGWQDFWEDQRDAAQVKIDDAQTAIDNLEGR